LLQTVDGAVCAGQVTVDGTVCAGQVTVDGAVCAGQVTGFILKLNATKGLKKLITRILFRFLSV